jgi:hypothetical protein
MCNGARAANRVRKIVAAPLRTLLNSARDFAHPTGFLTR